MNLILPIICFSGLLAVPKGMQGPNQLVVGAPPVETYGYATFDRIEIVAPYYISGIPTVFPKSKEVSFSYIAYNSPPVEGQFVAFGIHTEAVSFWPTTAAVLDNETVAVAGKGGDVDQIMTTIEIWKLTTPKVVFEVDPTTGQAHSSVTGVRVRSRTVVYNEAALGRDMVRALLRIRGKPHSIFVQFHDSNDLYELDYTQAVLPTSPPPVPRFPLTKLFGGTPGTDVPYVPELADRSRKCVSGSTHITQGVLYSWWVGLEDQMTNSGYAKPLIAGDWDNNGVIDGWSIPTKEQNQAAGILDQTQYSERRLSTMHPGW